MLITARKERPLLEEDAGETVARAIKGHRMGIAQQAPGGSFKAPRTCSMLTTLRMLAKPPSTLA